MMPGKTVVVDYGVGNLFSVAKALEKAGAQVEVTSDRQAVKQAERLVLPGVGSFGHCMANLNNYGLTGPVKEFAASGRPFLGICVGMQILFESSEESPGVAGLGLLRGHVRLLPDKSLKVPHIGWNSLDITKPGGIFRGLAGGYVYFVHSYYACPEDTGIISAKTDYGGAITAAVTYNNMQAVQFHPEKSGETGLNILQAFEECK